MSAVLDSLIARNSTYALGHTARPPLPTLNTIIVSCTDSRVDPAHILGIEPGEAVVLRNSGGRVTEAIEQDIGLLIAMASKAMGMPAKPNIVLIHHTQCGAEMLADPAVVDALSGASGIASEALMGLAIANHHTSLEEDVGRLAASRLVPTGVTVSALLYDQMSGRAEFLFSRTLS